MAAFREWVILPAASRTESNCSGTGLDRDQRATAGNPDEHHPERATRAKGLAEPLGNQPLRRRPRTPDVRFLGREAFVLQRVLRSSSNGRGVLTPRPSLPGEGRVVFLVARRDGRFGFLVGVGNSAHADVAGEFQGEELFVDPDFAAIGCSAVFALAEVEWVIAVVAGFDFVGEWLVANATGGGSTDFDGLPPRWASRVRGCQKPASSRAR